MIELKNISKWFYIKRDILHIFLPLRKIIALDTINLDIGKGEILAILGPNGAGKTTLIKIICGLLLPDRGKVKVKGNIGYLSGERESFYPQLTGWQNLEFFATLYNLTPSYTKKQIERYSNILQINDLDKPFWNYSTGTKHRLSLLRVLMLNRDIVIMDEPTKSLDPINAHQFRHFMSKLSKEFKKTIVFATHSLSEAEMVADRVIIINKGKLLIEATLKKVKQQFGNLDNLYSELIQNCLKQ
jgi:ABC-2 type transport system ATP-binding protein